MATYNGWDVIAIPTDPTAPASIEFRVVDSIALSISPFTGQQQVQDWGGTWMEATVAMPALVHDRAIAWVQFLRDLRGVKNVFQFTPEFVAAYTESIGTRYWRLKKNQRGWSISEARVFGITFEIMEAL